MAFGSLSEILHICEEEQMPFWKVVLRDDMNEREVGERMPAEVRETGEGGLAATTEEKEIAARLQGQS